MKEEILSLIDKALLEKIEQLRSLVSEAKNASIDPELVQKSKYETQAIEASYLADGYAQRLKDALESYNDFLKFKVKLPHTTEEVLVGSLIQLGSEGKTEYYFISPFPVLSSVQIAGKTIKIISENSPLAQSLINLKAFEEAELEIRNENRTFVIQKIL